MSVGPVLPPPAPLREGGSPLAADDGVPEFLTLRRTVSPTPMSGREAILTSLLVHALIIIFLLVVPANLFKPGAEGPVLLAFAQPSGEDRIPLAFIQDADRPPEPNPDAPFASDRDRRRGQEEQPPSPEEIGPFSRGNTPARIAQGNLGMVQPPTPPPVEGPRAAAPTEPPDQRGEEPQDPSVTEAEPAEARREVESFNTEAFLGRLGIPTPVKGDPDANGEEESRLQEKGSRLRSALSMMGASGSVGSGGGVPYKFDSPTAGLSTPQGTLSFDTKGFDWGPYARRIYWIIWSNWHARMPPAIYTGQRGEVTVRFVIEKDGELSVIRILAVSGIPAYDNAAVLALEASDPLPPLPDNFPKEREGVTGRFRYNMFR